MALLHDWFTGQEVALLLENRALATRGTTVRATHDDEGVSGLASINQPSVGHLVNDRMDLFWRASVIQKSFPVSASATEKTILFDFGTSVPVDTVVMAGSNLRHGFIRYAQWASPADPWPALENPDFESDTYPFVVRSQPGGAGAEEFLTFPWLTGPTIDQLDELQDQRRLIAIATAPEIFVGRYLAVYLDEGGLENGAEFEVSVPLIGATFRPVINMTIGWEISRERNAQIFDTQGGSTEGVERPGRRRFDFALPDLKDQDDAWRLQEVLDRVGALGRVWCWAEPLKPQYFARQSFVGVIERDTGFRFRQQEWPSTALTIKEVR